MVELSFGTYSSKENIGVWPVYPEVWPVYPASPGILHFEKWAGAPEEYVGF